MLVLTRRVNEEIIIGDKEIVIKVISTNGNQVSIGITAPRDIKVHRDEIYDKLKLKSYLIREHIKNGLRIDKR